MAGKGQKFKKYPDEIKLEIASKAREGRGYRSIGREYPNIPQEYRERISKYSDENYRELGSKS